MSDKTLYRCTIELRFVAELPTDPDEADRAADRIGDAVQDVLTYSHIDGVAAESWSVEDWTSYPEAESMQARNADD